MNEAGISQNGNGERSTLPYGSAGTFVTTLDHFQAVGLPNIIDRNAMPPSFSGSSTYEALHTLRYFKLIDDAGKPNVTVLERLMNGESRREGFLDLIRVFYPSLLGLPFATAGPTEVNRWFSDNSSPSTAKKAKAFFLSLARQCNVPMHPLVGQGARAPVGGVKRKRRKTLRAASEGNLDNTVIGLPADTQQSGQSPSYGNSKKVTLSSGGAVTLIVSIDPMELSDEDQAWVFGLIKQLRDYERTGGPLTRA